MYNDNTRTLYKGAYTINTRVYDIKTLLLSDRVYYLIELIVKNRK